MLNIDHPVGDGDETPSSGIYFTRFITFKGLRIGPIVMYIVLIIVRRERCVVVSRVVVHVVHGWIENSIYMMMGLFNINVIERKNEMFEFFEVGFLFI